LLDECGKFQPEPRAISHGSGGMMMPDDLNAIGCPDRTMTVTKVKMVRLPRIEELDLTGEMPIVVATNQDQFAKAAEPFD
jgi:hypothetical protein